MDMQNRPPDPDSQPDALPAFYQPSDLPSVPPAATPPGTPDAPITTRKRRMPGGIMPVLAVSLLSATMASAGTTVLLRPSETGAANPSPSPNTTTSVVHVDSGDAVVAVAAKVSPAVVTITSSSVNTRVGRSPSRRPASGPALSSTR